MAIWGGVLLTSLYWITSLGLVYIYFLFYFPNAFLQANFHQMAIKFFFQKMEKEKDFFGCFLLAKFVNED